MSTPDLHDDVLPIPCVVCGRVSERTVGELLAEDFVDCAVCGGATRVDVSQVKEFIRARKSRVPRNP